MGNLFACLGKLKKANERKPSRPVKQPLCEENGTVQQISIAREPLQWVAPSSVCGGEVSCHNHEDGDVTASFVEANGQVSEDSSKQLDFDGSRQPTSNSFKKAGNSPKKKVTFDVNVQTYESVPLCQHRSLDESGEDIQEEGKQQKAVSVYPSNHRYQNCIISGGEEEEDDLSCDRDDEVSVDASLSSWLTPPCYSCWSNNNSSSLDERPILGALTVDDLKQASPLSKSPRKSPCRSPDEMPIVGTVGRYWNHISDEYSATKGIPNTTSKYSEDKQVNWHSTPFEVRLERALGKGSLGGASCDISYPVC